MSGVEPALLRSEWRREGCSHRGWTQVRRLLKAVPRMQACGLSRLNRPNTSPGTLSAVSPSTGTSGISQLNVWKHRFLAAGLAVLGLLPFVGDSTKGARLLVKFAKRGDRAEQAVREVTAELPLSAAVKKNILDALPSRAGKLPIELVGGPTLYLVYKGEDYVGITSDFPRRMAQHSKAGRSFVPDPIPGASGLTLGEARAIEQAGIAQGGLAGSGGGLQTGSTASIRNSSTTPQRWRQGSPCSRGPVARAR